MPMIMRDLPQTKKPETAEFRFIAEEPDVPLLVLLGSKDTITPLKEGNCEKMLDDRKALHAPVSYKIYPATHIWDWPELPHLGWTDVVYDPEITEQSAKDMFEFLDSQLKSH